MIVKIRTKGNEIRGLYYNEEVVYLWIMGNNSWTLIDAEEVPECVERSIYENDFIEIYILTA